VDADLIHSARLLGASERQIMTSVIIPSALCVDLRVPDALHLLRPHRGGGRRVHRRRIGWLGVIGIVMALGIKQVEARLLRWRPEYQKR
jgi:ABC-type nitrate/sulfonate/bicarbonate transport system permease component